MPQNEQFNDALRAANAGDVDLLQQYQSMSCKVMSWAITLNTGY